jgi:hypothetical protein
MKTLGEASGTFECTPPGVRAIARFLSELDLTGDAGFRHTAWPHYRFV